jgi:uncharacterized OsmC-like protein
VAKVVVRKSDERGCYVGEAGDFKVDIELTENKSPRSIDLVLLGLGSCTISTIAHYLRRKGIPPDCVDVELSAELDEKANTYREFRIMLYIADGIPPEMRKIIATIAKSCRVHRTLATAPHIAVEVAEPADV